MGLQKAKLVNQSIAGALKDRTVEVQFNPTEYGIDRGAQWAEVPIPGLKMPLLQFVRGDSRVLTVELFLDASNARESVEEKLRKLRSLVEVDGTLHAPPVVSFEWGGGAPSLSSTSAATAAAGVVSQSGSATSQPVAGSPPPAATTPFIGVVTSLKEKFSLFDQAGNVVRARVTLTMKSYEAPEVQLRGTARQSPDRTKVRVFREGESLAKIADEEYGDPRLWRSIAEANDIDRPRFIPPGTPLKLPAVE
jgi:hypothetical protein